GGGHGRGGPRVVHLPPPGRCRRRAAGEGRRGDARAARTAAGPHRRLPQLLAPRDHTCAARGDGRRAVRRGPRHRGGEPARCPGPRGRPGRRGRHERRRARDGVDHHRRRRADAARRQPAGGPALVTWLRHLRFAGALGPMTRRLTSIVLGGLAMTLFFGALVARQLELAGGGTEQRANALLVGGTVLAVLAIVAAGGLRRSWGVTLGWVVLG